MKKVIKIEMPIRWVKNRTWGYNPNCNAVIYFNDGTEETTKKYRCSGCGYDKLSTIISKIYDDYLADDRKEYFDKNPDENSAPYGMEKEYFCDGVGVNCYHRISEALGGKLERVYGDNTFDFYVFTKNEVTNEI